MPAWLQKKLTDFHVALYSWREVRARRKHKCVWRCYRDGGGGSVNTPKAMSETGAVAWVNRNHGEVFYVDFDHRFIFYRSRG